MPGDPAESALRTPIACSEIGNFTSQDFIVFLHSFCADLSSPQISAILVVGRFAMAIPVSANLRNASAHNAQKSVKILPRDIPYPRQHEPGFCNFLRSFWRGCVVSANLRETSTNIAQTDVKILARS